MSLMEIARKEKKYATIFDKLDKLVEQELEKARDEHGEFASMHEGVSVLLEEIEETEDVIKSIKKLYAEAWGGVKNDDYTIQQPILAKLYLKGLYLSMEAIQVTAMAQKYYKYIVENNPQSTIPGQMNLMDAATPAVQEKVEKLVEAEE